MVELSLWLVVTLCLVLVVLAATILGTEPLDADLSSAAAKFPDHFLELVSR